MPKPLSFLNNNSISKNKTSIRYIVSKKKEKYSDPTGPIHVQNATIGILSNNSNNILEIQSLNLFETYEKVQENNLDEDLIESNTITYNHSNGSIIWEVEMSYLNINNRKYQVEILSENIKEIYQDYNFIVIHMKNTPKITELFSNIRLYDNSTINDNKNDYIYNNYINIHNNSNNINDHDVFLQSIKNWRFCRVLCLKIMRGNINYEKYFKREVNLVMEINILEDNLLNNLNNITKNGSIVMYDIPIEKFDNLLPFSTKFLLNCLNCKFPGLLNDINRFKDVYNVICLILKDKNRDSILLIENSLRVIMDEENIDYNSIASLIEQNLSTNYRNTKNGNEKVLVNRIIITPLNIEYYQSYEIGNRVIRAEFNQDYDFLRVSFSDDSRQRLFLSFLPQFKRKFKEIVKKGIDICGRRFEMLGYSNSQLRSYGAWFVSGGNPQEIIDKMGNFSKIKEPGKYASRFGLCLSTTRKGYDVKFIIGKDYQDVDRKYIFNDGIGKISHRFAMEIAEKLKIYRNGELYIPSAFQFRMHTFKGVVQLDVADQVLEQFDLIMSPNQCKVPTDEYTTEIGYGGKFELVTTSERKGISFLNKQIIALLVSNKLPLSILEKLVDEEIERLSANNMQYLSTKMVYHKIARNISKYSHLLFDSFCLDIQRKGMKSWKKQMLEFRIPILSSCSLIGVFDFSLELEPDEVFIQLSPLLEGNFYPNSSLPNGGIVEGEILVTKSPCLHPGDVRKLKAINDYRTEKFKHLTDVIVFSGKGERPQPSKMSGSDLDGDIYFITWDERLLQFEEYEPMNYESSSDNHYYTECNYQSIRDFFIEYNENDILGKIAVKHLELCDKEPEGARSNNCLKYAELHSQQVDSVKTGCFVDYKLIEKTTTRPHFMNSTVTTEQYHSNSVLGKLFTHIEYSVERQVKNSNTNQFKSLELPNIKYRKERVEFEIEDLYIEYKNELWSLMRRYHIASEASMISGFINYSKKASFCGQSDYTLRESIMESIQIFVNEYECKINELMKLYNDIPRKTMAQYFFEIVNRQNDGSNSQFGSSFYWFVIDDLLEDE